jgi:hypothetical protein
MHHLARPFIQSPKRSPLVGKYGSKEKNMATESTQAKGSATQQPVSSWAALNKLREWDPEAVKMTTIPGLTSFACQIHRTGAYRVES